MTRDEYPKGFNDT